MYINGPRSGQQKPNAPYIDTFFKYEDEPPLQIWGISDKKLDLLKRIVNNTGAKIVLSSSWRSGYVAFKNPVAPYVEDPEYPELDFQFCIGKYLCRKFNEFDLQVLDFIGLQYSYRRAKGILAWIEDNTSDYNVTNYICLDDESFDYFFAIPDYQRHVILTNPIYGLTASDVDKAIRLLNKPQKRNGGQK